MLDSTLTGLAFWRSVPRVDAAAPTLGCMLATLSGLRRPNFALSRSFMIDHAIIDQQMSQLARLLKNMKADLERGGYVFDSPQDALQPPSPNTFIIVRKMEASFESFPYAVESFYKYIGSVDFCGSTKAFDELDYPDPLQLAPFDYYNRCFEEYQSSEEDKGWWIEGWGGFALLMSADYYHKENVSGGPEYSIRIPAASDDPPLENTPWERSFLDYLALVLKYGGFPGYKTENLALPPYYRDTSILRESQNLFLRFSELAQECRNGRD